MYRFQTTDYNCSPTALYNVFVWLFGESPLTIDEWMVECKTTKDGTYDEDLERAIKKFLGDRLIKKLKSPKRTDLEKFFCGNRAAILSFFEPWEELPRDNEWHTCLLLPKKCAVNLLVDKPVTTYTPAMLGRMLKTRGSRAWVIKR